ncbi:hypothetical protein BDV25DRAFT_152600 [Aspergillus avenaceus]|uniref:Uncharacterized protein n=1 Tax=Aspergillus avenaceus TaxID=36643 RepID=A0A5N6TYN3_ASPAV|nr:hypothetical protein BDV25DRAFT_152600 [Aspergillus avenaceus]
MLHCYVKVPHLRYHLKRIRSTRLLILSVPIATSYTTVFSRETNRHKPLIKFSFQNTSCNGLPLSLSPAYHLCAPDAQCQVGTFSCGLAQLRSDL